MNKEDSRYPYTYSADHIRMMTGYNEQGSTKLSRSDAAHIKAEIAKIIGMDERKLAELIADDFIRRNA